MAPPKVEIRLDKKGRFKAFGGFLFFGGFFAIFPIIGLEECCKPLDQLEIWDWLLIGFYTFCALILLLMAAFGIYTAVINPRLFGIEETGVTFGWGFGKQSINWKNIRFVFIWPTKLELYVWESNGPKRPKDGLSGITGYGFTHINEDMGTFCCEVVFERQDWKRIEFEELVTIVRHYMPAKTTCAFREGQDPRNDPENALNEEMETALEPIMSTRAKTEEDDTRDFDKILDDLKRLIEELDKKK